MLFLNPSQTVPLIHAEFQNIQSTFHPNNDDEVLCNRCKQFEFVDFVL